MRKRGRGAIGRTRCGLKLGRNLGQPDPAARYPEQVALVLLGVLRSGDWLGTAAALFTW